MRLTKVSVVVLAIGLVATQASATEVHMWSARFGGSSTDTASGVALDGDGNTYLAGDFRGPATFGDVTLPAGGFQDGFLVKVDPAGTVLWAKQFTGTSLTVAVDVAVDPSDQVIVSGVFAGTVDFGGGPIGSGFDYDVFVAKFDPSGGHVWSIARGGSGQEAVESVATDSTGDVVVGGYYAGTSNLGGASLPLAGAPYDAFVVKYDGASGAHEWSRRAGEAGVDATRAVAVDDGDNVYVGGLFQSSIDWGAGGVSTVGSYDGHLTRFAADGSVDWTIRVGGAGQDDIRAIAIDRGGNPVVTGMFDGATNWGGGPLPSYGDWDVPIASYAGVDGSHRWSTAIGGAAQDLASGIAVDINGHAVVAGFAGGSADLGGGVLAGGGGRDAYLSRFDAASGAFSAARMLGSAGSEWARAIDARGPLLALAGEFAGTFDPGGGPLTSASSDAFGAVYLTDDQAPVSEIDTAELSVLVGDPLGNDAVTGSVTDDLSGVVAMSVTFDPILSLGVQSSVAAALACDARDLSCTWTADVPGLTAGGIYRVTASASDRAGNVETPGPGILVIVV